MRIAVLILLTLGSTLLVAQDQTIERTGESPVEAKFVSGGSIRMDLCPGEINLVGKDENVVRISYHGRAEADDLNVRLQVSGNHADLKVRGCPNNNFEMTVEVPKNSNLYVRMFAGQMNVNDITGDKDVEIHAGQLTMDIGKPEDYFRVEASVLTGSVEAPAFNVSKGGLFRSFERGGPGKYRLHAHVGAGEIDLR
jgi:hypothetical protein